MALNTMRYPLSQMAKRRFAAQAAVRPADNAPTPEVSCTLLPNKLMVSSLDLCGPLSRVSIMFRVGSRHETSKNLGITHAMRIMAGFGTQKCTGFSVWKNIQYNGGHIYCTADRETTGFHLVSARHKILDSLKFLSALACSPGFKPWEVRDNLYRLNYEIGGLSPQIKVIESLHSAAFRSGLGNSLFVAEDRIGTHTPAMMESFFSDKFTANRAAVIGYNVYERDMLEFAKSIDLYVNEIDEGNHTYYGGEIRHNVNSYFANVAVATEGVGYKDIKEALIYCVLQHAFGVNPVISWGGSQSPLYKATYPVAPDAGVSCLNISYSDNGLFGFIVSSSAETAGKAMLEAFKIIKSGSVSEADFKRAKALVRMHVLANSENSGNVVEDLGVQSLLTGVIIPGSVLAEAIDKITLSDVNTAAKKVAGGKFSLAAYGDLTSIPYLSDLK